MKKNNTRLVKIIFRILIILLILGAIFSYLGYGYISKPNINPEQDKAIFYVPNGSTFQSLFDTLTQREILQNPSAFKIVADAMKFGDANVKTGRYQVDKNWSNRSLINALRAGKQKGIPLIINNVRTVDDLVGSVSKQIELDSSSFSQYIYKKGPSVLGTNKENLITYFIPNTYEVWWNSSPESLLNRMKEEHEKWWTSKNRDAKLESLGLSREEAYTLASIVDKESNLNSEKPRLAGVYLNRVNKGIPLQADPTVVFANKQYDLRRVLNKHLEFDSPYNTYKYAGLPPGPIYMASISGLNAVINAEKHNYLYFCAAPGYGSAHQFAKTLTQHNINARKFHAWLNKQGIR